MVKKTAMTLAAALCCLAGACALLAPYPAVRSVSGQVLCVWEDGARSETLASALDAYAGIGDHEILLARDGKRGYVAVGQPFEEAAACLSGDSLLALLTMKAEGLSAFEYACLSERFANTLYYSADLYRLQGKSVGRTPYADAEEVVLLDGAFPSGFLAQTGASRLRLTALSEITADDFRGTHVRSVEAVAPYRMENALYLETPGGVRLLAALPETQTLVLGESDFTDRGALCAATRLRSLTLPYLGSALRPAATGYDGSLKWLFEMSDGDTMPETLRTVKVTGGHIAELAFYGCALEEADLCGVEREEIARQAFVGADVARIHTPRADLELPAGYRRSTAPCGCTIYEKEGTYEKES